MTKDAHIARAMIILKNEVPATQAVITAVSNLEAALPPQGTIDRAEAFHAARKDYRDSHTESRQEAGYIPHGKRPGEWNLDDPEDVERLIEDARKRQ